MRTLMVVVVFWASSAAAQNCVPAGEPLVRLIVQPALLAGQDDSLLTVGMHAGGCVLIHRPAFWKSAGDYTLQLEAQAQAKLEALVATHALRRFDAQAVKAALEADAEPEREYETLDPDLVIVESRGPAGKSTAIWRGLAQDAELHPDQRALQDLNTLVQALQALSERSDMVKIGGAP